jgi:hypothetical protein
VEGSSGSGARGPIDRLVPLQRPGSDEVLRKDKITNPGVDRRLFLDRAMLRKLLDMAESSITGRVVLHGAELTVELLKGKDGNVYESWTISGAPRAEGSLLDELYAGTTGGTPRVRG